jgi:hypothetical protein
MNCQEPQRPADRAATHLVRHCLPDVEVCLHDDGSQPMMHDLDLQWPDGHTGAMEVTLAIDADLLRLDLRLARHGSVIPARETTRTWTLMLASGTTEVRAVRDKADHLLSLVERAEITMFSWRDGHQPVPAAQALHWLGVAHGISSNASSEPPSITLLGPGPAVYHGQPKSINAVVEDHARRNEMKLQSFAVVGECGGLCSVA